eukprot:3771113-Rhodomonas_salina.2
MSGTNGVYAAAPLRSACYGAAEYATEIGHGGTHLPYAMRGVCYYEMWDTELAYAAMRCGKAFDLDINVPTQQDPSLSQVLPDLDPRP